MVRAMKAGESIDEKRKSLSPSKADDLQSELERVHEDYQIQLYELKSQLETATEKLHDYELQQKLS